jgi:intracellular sulfur oxidation DsrE/DsrF family protein
MSHPKWARRSLISGLSASLGAVVFGSRAAAQPKTGGFQPARHEQDEWLDKVPGKHRVFIDVISASGAGEAVGFANNLYTFNKEAYGIDEGDLAVVMCLRHSATVFAFTDAIWSKHGKAMADSSRYTNPRSTEPPTANPYTAPPRDAFGALIKRGMQFAVCNSASRRISRALAGPDGDAEAMYKTMVANLIPSSRLVPAGVVALTRSQEYGYSLLYGG